MAEVDLRVGGKWRYVMVADGGFEVAFHGEYRELIKNERIVSTEVFEGMPEAEAVDTMTFTEVDGRTTNTILVQHTSREHRDAPHQLRRGRGTAGRVGSAGTGGDFAALAQSHSSSVQWSRPRSGDH